MQVTGECSCHRALGVVDRCQSRTPQGTGGNTWTPDGWRKIDTPIQEVEKEKEEKR